MVILDHKLPINTQNAYLSDLNSTDFFGRENTLCNRIHSAMLYVLAHLVSLVKLYKRQKSNKEQRLNLQYRQL